MKNKINNSIQDLGNFWRIEGVKYRNKISSYDLSKSLLPSMSYKQSIEHAINSKQTGDFYTSDSILLYSIINSAYNQRKNPLSEEIRSFIQTSMINYVLQTISLGQYTSKGKDIMIHNQRLDNEFSIKDNLVGKDGYIQNIDSKDYLNAFLGTSNKKEINKRFQWLNNTDAYIFRSNSKPMKLQERVAWFIADSVGVILDCGRNPSYSYPALGVRKSAEGTQKILEKNYTLNDIKQAIKDSKLEGIEEIILRNLK